MLGENVVELLMHIYTNYDGLRDGITTLEAHLYSSLEAHWCGLGTLTREALVTIGSGPNRTPPLNGVDGIPKTTEKITKTKKSCTVFGLARNISRLRGRKVIISHARGTLQ